MKVIRRIARQLKKVEEEKVSLQEDIKHQEKRIEDLEKGRKSK